MYNWCFRSGPSGTVVYLQPKGFQLYAGYYFALTLSPPATRLTQKHIDLQLIMIAVSDFSDRGRCVLLRG